MTSLNNFFVTNVCPYEEFIKIKKYLNNLSDLELIYYLQVCLFILHTRYINCYKIDKKESEQNENK